LTATEFEWAESRELRLTQDATVATLVAGAEQKIRTEQFSDSYEDSMTSTPVVGGTSMGTARTDEMTSCICSYFGEAAELMVDPGLLDEAQIRDEGGMLLIGPVAMVCDVDDCFGTSEECSAEPSSDGGSAPVSALSTPLSLCGSLHKVSSTEPAVAEDVKCEKNGKNRDKLSSGSTAVGERDEVSQGSTAPQPLSLSANCNELSFWSNNKIGDGAWLNHPASDNKDFEESEMEINLRNSNRKEKRTMKSPEVEQQEVL